MTDPYQGPVLTLKLQGRVNKNSVKINKIQIFDLIFYFIKSIIIFGNFMGIHYDYKSTRGAKAMEKQAKREKKLAERRAKRAAKEGFKQTKSESNMHDIAKPITLEDLTNPEKKNDK